MNVFYVSVVGFFLRGLYFLPPLIILLLRSNCSIVATDGRHLTTLWDVMGVEANPGMMMMMSVLV